MNNKVAFFDFCETLVDFQTADTYVDFVRKCTEKRRMMFLERIQSFLNKIKIIRVVEKICPNQSFNKKIKLYQLKHFRYEDLDSFAHKYYLECIKPHFISVMLERLLSLKSNGYKVGLVSGGYDIYLKYFVEEYQLDFCISSKIEFHKDICTGKMSGLDCLYENKLKLLSHLYPQKPIECVAYSDSFSDLPLLKWANNGVVVSHNKSQEWSNVYKFDEIIW